MWLPFLQELEQRYCRCFCGIVPATRLCPSNVQTICWGSLEEDLDADITWQEALIATYLLTYLLTCLFSAGVDQQDPFTRNIKEHSLEGLVFMAMSLQDSPSLDFCRSCQANQAAGLSRCPSNSCWISRNRIATETCRARFAGVQLRCHFCTRIFRQPIWASHVDKSLGPGVMDSKGS